MIEEYDYLIMHTVPSIYTYFLIKLTKLITNFK